MYTLQYCTVFREIARPFYTRISVIRKRVIRNRVPFLNRNPHNKIHVASGEWGVKDTTALIPAIQNVWAPYLTMRHVLLESFVWEEANRVPFLIREVS